MTIIELESDAALDVDHVGPVIRAGRLAECVIDAVAADNPDRDVVVVDRDDYVRIHTRGRCRLTRESLERALGEAFQLEALEIEMPSFKGRLRTRTDEFLWYLTTSDGEA
ncbi:toluene 4-monooxygenase protein D [Pseudonocardia thermophila]|jgi:MmoB/DmpM family.|uniref:Toluene 4-monooxygenase protein D n=1 Tax=Pseudonocardia thermophila TaxID=1848 RepID=A0A1M6PPK9_PSETH|nr:MmoB/DmpM family protein [Pseudonocardia thermophila]SHK09768.1 toluene 4-monooxygenase protein D [Pseudonocardia thermophila]